MKTDGCMRTLVSLAILLAMLSGCKHSNTETASAEVAAVEEPKSDVPQRQASSLTPTRATIGPKGGTLSSSDNRLSLSIPAGVFASDTEVSIQPTQGGEDGLGAAYRLMPEGVTFPQPVTLAWHLSEDDLAQTNLDNLSVSSQAANGAWTIQDGTQRDEAAHTLTVNVSHFSLWQLAQTLHITPPASRVYCGDPLSLFAELGGVYVSKHAPQPKQAPQAQANSGSGDDLAAPSPQHNNDDDILTPPGKDDDLLTGPARELEKTGDDAFAIIRTAVWRVNGVVGGSSTAGTVRRSFYWWGDYVAPAQEPSPSRVVTVSVEVTVGPHKMIASALVEILPHVNHWIGTSKITQFDGTTVTSNFTFAPVRSFERRGRQVGRQRFEILDGMVYYKGPKTTGSGCNLDIKPTHHRMQPKEGSLYIDAQNPKIYLVNGGGQSVWSAIYEASCPNGTQSVQSSVSAAWWPTDPTQMSSGAPNMIPVDVTPGKPPQVLIQVDTPFGKGTVTLKNQDSPLQQPAPPS
jgi:hypothetical protein